MGHGASPARRGSATATDHAAMGHGAAHGGGSTRSGTTGGHAGHAAGARQGASASHASTSPASAGATGHGGHAPPTTGGAHAGMQHGRPGAGAPLPAGPGTDKLLTLVGELVRDPVVRERIQEDPALREGWSDPGVRRIVTRAP